MVLTSILHIILPALSLPVGILKLEQNIVFLSLEYQMAHKVQEASNTKIILWVLAVIS
jgi:hypothetical protein